MIRELAKFTNLVALSYSYLKSSITGSTYIEGVPVALGVELTNNCNLNCPECASGSGMISRSRGFMNQVLFKRVMDEIGGYLLNVNLFFQGEPMLHPQFFNFIESCGSGRIVVSTNGHFLTEDNARRIVSSKLNRLIISIDGTDQETYSVYRVNGDLSTVLTGLSSLVTAKERYSSSIRIDLQFLVNRFNEHQIPLVKKLAEDMHVSLKLKSMQILHSDNIAVWEPSDQRYRRYKMVNGKYSVKSRFPDRCARLWFNPVITWDGKVIPCCFDKDAEYIMGDLNTDSFRDIWNGPKYRSFRKSILTGRHMIEICRNCTSGLRGVRK